MLDDMLIHKTKWHTYLKFRNLCCVPTIPFPAGPCWTTYEDSAFIGYNHVFRDNRLRFRAMPLLLMMSHRKRLQFFNENMLCLNRIMTKYEYRGQGIAREMIVRTLKLTKKPLIECITFTPAICRILADAGFKCFGWDSKKSYYYYLFFAQINLEKFIANWYIKSEKQ